MPIGIFLIIVLVALGGYVLMIYNRFVRTKTRIKASVQEIGNQLKRQADLIPNLTASVKGYMKHEKKIFADLTSARKAVKGALKSNAPQKMVEASSKMLSALAPIQAVFESTPELQAAKPTVKLMDELRDTADKVMYSRRTLIDLTADYNVMIETVPSKWVAGVFNFKPEPGLKTPAESEFTTVEKGETKTPKVNL